jgi:hypothetical protein
VTQTRRLGASLSYIRAMGDQVSAGNEPELAKVNGLNIIVNVSCVRCLRVLRALPAVLLASGRCLVSRVRRSRAAARPHSPASLRGLSCCSYNCKHMRVVGDDGVECLSANTLLRLSIRNRR